MKGIWLTEIPLKKSYAINSYKSMKINLKKLNIIEDVLARCMLAKLDFSWNIKQKRTVFLEEIKEETKRKH